MKAPIFLVRAIASVGLAASTSCLFIVPSSFALEGCSPTNCYGYAPHEADFWITIASDNGVNTWISTEIIDGTRTGDVLPRGAKYHCVGWQYGQKVKALGLNSYDARWYLVEVPGAKEIGFLGNTRWIPAAWVFGDAPGSQPLP